MTATAPPAADIDDRGAFVPHAPFDAYGPGGQGPLAGLTLAVKDLFDVEGLVTGGGTPAWAEGRAPAEADAPPVAALRAAGARLVGKTVTDELAWSLNGENVHYGTPRNPAAAGRIPGGSSSGSAVAVAAGLADIGLGTDTGGSVRLPASYCGVWGLRPSHGAISLRGAVPLAPSYDTVGWFARDAATLHAAGRALLTGTPTPAPTRLWLAEDAFARVDPTLRDALIDAAHSLADRLGLPLLPVTLAPEDFFPDGLAAWRGAFRVAQSAEVWETHGAWVRAANPTFGPGIADRFAYAASLDPTEIAVARATRAAIAARMRDLTAGAAILMPGAAGIAPPLGLTGPALDDIRDRALEIMCPAGHAGLPQLAIPALHRPEGPLGLGLIGPAGADLSLLALVETF
ncbi:MAG: amidase [Alkalilacustris sp.]